MLKKLGGYRRNAWVDIAGICNNGVHIVTGLRSNMKQRLMPLYDKIMLRKRSIIESINDMLKNVAQLVSPSSRNAI